MFAPAATSPRAPCPAIVSKSYPAFEAHLQCLLAKPSLTTPHGELLLLATVRPLRTCLLFSLNSSSSVIVLILLSLNRLLEGRCYAFPGFLRGPAPFH